MVLTLPADPDASARRIRDALVVATDVDVAVIISDTHGRAWRLGTVNVAIGAVDAADRRSARADRPHRLHPPRDNGRARR